MEGLAIMSAMMNSTMQTAILMAETVVGLMSVSLYKNNKVKKQLNFVI